MKNYFVILKNEAEEQRFINVSTPNANEAGRRAKLLAKKGFEVCEICAEEEF